METNNSGGAVLQEINMLYRKYNINVCVGCEFEHTASCDTTERLAHCQQQLLKYHDDLEFHKSLFNGEIVEH